MARRDREKAGADAAPIDHARIIDGFGEKRGRAAYEGYETACGACGRRFVFTAAAQKYVHETRGVPIKKARRAAYCDACAKKRGDANRRRRRSTELERAVAETSLEARADRASAAKGEAYVTAHLRLLEERPNRKSAERLASELRRIAKLEGAPDLSPLMDQVQALLGGDTDA